MSGQPTIYVQLSADGSAIRKWSYEPFDEGTAYTRTPDPAVLIEALVRIATDDDCLNPWQEARSALAQWDDRP